MRSTQYAAARVVAVIAVLCIFLPAFAKESAGKRAGLRVGSWSPDDLTEIDDADYSESPLLEGYFEKNLDVRLSIESTVSLWRRSMERSESGLTGTSTEETDSYVLPIFTTLKFYPMRHDRRNVTPYFSGGIGLALGLEKSDATGPALPGAPADPGTRNGYGYNAGAGLDWNPGQSSLGLSLVTRYQNLRFDQEMAGDRYFKGFVIAAGATYRFQKD